MPRLSRRSAWPLYLQIADDLRAKILRQEWAPGARLPSEHSLMESYGASRQTVRRAVAVLKTEGLVDAAQGQGVFVRATAPLVRRLGPRLWGKGPGGGAGFVCTLNEDDEVEAEKETETVDASTDIAHRLGLREGAPVTVRRWKVRANGHPLQVATSYVAAVRLGADAAQPATPEDVYEHLSDLGHQVEYLTEHVVTRMPQPAEAAALDLGPGTPVILVSRTAFDAAGTPLETCDAMLSAEHHELVYEIPATEPARLVTSADELAAAMAEVVDGAREQLVAVGSRAHGDDYLAGIERVLAERPELVHYRVLMGPPRSPLLKEHLVRLFELRTPGPRRSRTLHVGIVDDLASDHERFFVASERGAVVALPSASSPERFDTGLVVRDPLYVEGLLHHAKVLHGRRPLESLDAVAELPVR